MAKILLGIVAAFCIVTLFLSLPTATKEYKVQALETWDTSSNTVEEEVIPDDYYIRVNSQKVVIRNTKDVFQEYVIDSITQWKDVKNIIWSKGTTIIVIESADMVLIESGSIIRKYDVRKTY
jgi:hypothetical protein